MVPKLILLFFVLLFSNFIHCAPVDAEEENISKKGTSSNKIFHGQKAEEVSKMIHTKIF